MNIISSIGGDNVNDAWFPLSNFDPINLMAFSMPIAHLAPWDRLGLSPFTSSAASILNLQWDGVLQKGISSKFKTFNNQLIEFSKNLDILFLI